MSARPLACRPACAACCIAPSISSPIPQPDGGPPLPKPAGMRCVQLDDHARCRLFGRPERPAVCASLRPSEEMCGDSPAAALRWLTRLERLTAAGPAVGSAPQGPPTGMAVTGGPQGLAPVADNPGSPD